MSRVPVRPCSVCAQIVIPNNDSSCPSCGHDVDELSCGARCQCGASPGTRCRLRRANRATHDGLTRDPNHKGPPLKLPSYLYKGKVTVAEAIRRNIPGIREAIKGFVKFHGGVKPSDEIVLIEDGRKDDVAGFLVGRAAELTYDDVPTGSNKQGSIWTHKTSKKTPSYFAHIPLTGTTTVVGPMRVTDWMRG